jgi:hypothetical protein
VRTIAPRNQCAVWMQTGAWRGLDRQLVLRQARGRTCVAPTAACLADRAFGASDAAAQGRGQHAHTRGAPARVRPDAASLKDELRQLTSPGARASRGEIEEAQVALEALGGAIDYGVLRGLWRLRYTTAADVVRLFVSPQRHRRRQSAVTVSTTHSTP